VKWVSGTYLVLNNRIGQAVADTHALEVDIQALFGVVPIEDSLGDGGSVVAAVRFAEHVELAVCTSVKSSSGKE
jgi:hypothetical protein